MKTFETKRKWKISKGKLKQKKVTLTVDHLRYIGSKEIDLLGRIQKRAGETRESVLHALADCCGC
jgi:hypothetical protein